MIQDIFNKLETEIQENEKNRGLIKPLFDRSAQGKIRALRKTILGYMLNHRITCVYIEYDYPSPINLVILLEARSGYFRSFVIYLLL